LASFLCAVKRDKGGRPSADDSSKEERVRGHDAASLCQGVDRTVSAYHLNIVAFVRSVEDVLEHVLKRFCFRWAALIWTV
jgi:hypothetical protein